MLDMSPLGDNPVCVVLGSGANAYGLLRSLGLGGFKTVQADYGHGPASNSRLPVQHWRTPHPIKEESLRNFLVKRLAQLHTELFVIPTDEPWVNFLHRQRVSFADNIHLAIAKPSVVDLVLSKSAMHRWCKHNRFQQPLTNVFYPGESWHAFLDWALGHSPVILKPDTKGIGDGGLGIYTADFQTKNQLLQWAEGIGAAGPACTVLAQGLISGPGAKLTAWHGYRSEQGVVSMAGVTKLRSRTPRLGGCTTAAEYTADASSRDIALRMLEELDYSGFFDLEFIIRPNGEAPLFVELNPRPGNPNFAATAMGLNLPLLALAHMRGGGPQTSEIVTNQPGLWVDMSVDPLLAMTGANSLKKRVSGKAWMLSLGSGPLVDAYFNRKDPMVFVSACARLALLGLKFGAKKLAKPKRSGIGGSKFPSP